MLNAMRQASCYLAGCLSGYCTLWMAGESVVSLRMFSIVSWCLVSSLCVARGELLNNFSLLLDAVLVVNQCWDCAIVGYASTAHI